MTNEILVRNPGTSAKSAAMTMDGDPLPDRVVTRRGDRTEGATPPPPRPTGSGDGDDAGAAEQGDEPVRRLSHDGQFGEIFVLFLANLALSILTLGIYRFWAKTRIRRYLWSHTSFDGDRLEYSGTGLELFLGFLFALVFLVPTIVGLQLVELYFPDNVAAQVSALIALYVILLYLYGIAIYSAYRYRLSRTAWRGIRGSVAGSAWTYGTRFFLLLLLSLVTLGFSTPFEKIHLWRYSVNNTRFGDRPLRFEGKGRDLLKLYAICWLFYIWTFSLSMIWFRAAALRYLAENTSYENLRFNCTLSGERLFEFYLGNLALMILTLGFAWPYVALRHARLVADHVEVIGEPDYGAIRQAQERGPRTGEGLADLLHGHRDVHRLPARRRQPDQPQSR